MTNEEANKVCKNEIPNLGQMAGKTLFTAWHSTDYENTKVSCSDVVKPCHSILLELSLPNHQYYLIREPQTVSTAFASENIRPATV